MSTNQHYFIEETPDGKFAVRAKDSGHASKLLDTQAEAIAYAKELNPEDHPDISRVRNTTGGGPDQWRAR